MTDETLDRPGEHGMERTSAEAEPAAVAHEPELTAHPGPKQYVVVAIVLALITALEVGLYYLDIAHAVLVGLLLFLAILKFALVALWFMHLRFDNKIFQRLFVTGIVLALSVYIVVLVIFRALEPPFLIGLAVFLVGFPGVALLLRQRRAVPVPPDQEPALPAASHG